MKLDKSMLQELELTMDTYNPRESKIPIKILGYGEISLVFSIPDDPAGNIAYKRLPIFDSKEQTEAHIEAYKKYNQLLEKIGILVPDYGAEWVYRDERKRNITLFCAQKIVPEDTICNKLLHTRTDDEIYSLTSQILNELAKIWNFNLESDDLKLGFDGQISNFSEIDGKLYYLDTSTPMYRINGQDAMEATLFLKSAPPGIRFLLKIFFLQEVLDRYYDFREVLIDLLANFYKEQRADLIPKLVEIVNDFINTNLPDLDLDPISEKEVKSYYKSDKFIWVLFQRVRYLHRFITSKIFRKKYPFYLPQKIDR